MRINRINIIISSAQNTHKKYLYNECLDLMNKYKFGGCFGRDSISMNSMPETVLKELKKLKINFERKQDETVS